MPRHTPDHVAEESPVPLPTLIHYAVELLKAALNVFVAEGPILDDPGDLSEQTTAQSGFYTHRGLGSRTSGNRPPP